MPDVDVDSVRGLPPQVMLLLVLLGSVAGLAAVLFGCQRRFGKTPSFRPIAPHPSQPTSMLTFVALPTFLILTSLVIRLPLTIVPLDPINSPQSGRRHADAPIDLVLNDWDSPHPYGYPEDTADLTAKTAARVGLGPPQQRAQAVRDLAWWTAVCPDYAPFTLPRLVGALQDSELAVRTAAVAGLGSIGGHASAAVPGLLAARGTSVVYFDYLLDEAVFLIERTAKWPAEAVCEGASVEELERRAVQQEDAPAEGHEEGAQ